MLALDGGLREDFWLGGIAEAEATARVLDGGWEVSNSGVT